MRGLPRAANQIGHVASAVVADSLFILLPLPNRRITLSDHRLNSVAFVGGTGDFPG